MIQSWIISVSSIVILAAIALLFLYLSLRGMRDDALSSWKSLLDKLRIRDDMVPGLIETVRKYSKNEEKLLQDMIALRAKSWPMEELNGQKVNVELSLTSDLHAVWKLPQKVAGLDVDTIFLALKKDFRDLGKEIDDMTEDYNKKIRTFNSRVGFILLKPFFLLFGLKTLPIFEFEP